MSVRFCSICQNLMFVKMTDLGALVASCNYCLSKEELSTGKSGAVVISETTYRSDAAKYSHLVNPLLHEDPTLPRVVDVPCPNPYCSKPGDEANNALFVKYDADNLKFLYSCTFCKHFWVPGQDDNPGKHDAPDPAEASGIRRRRVSKGASEKSARPRKRSESKTAITPTGNSPRA